MPGLAGITKKNKEDDLYGADSEVGSTPLSLECAACTGSMREGEPRIEDADKKVYHPEHYSAT